MALSNFLKKLIVFDVVWGTRSKKLAGINDGNNFINTSIISSSVDNSFKFVMQVPSFFQKDQYFRVFGGANDSRLFKIKEIKGDKIITYEGVVDGISNIKLDARLWVVHNNPKVSRSTSTGSTMFNVHNRNTSGVDGDASALALTFAEHYHDENGEEDDKGVLVSTLYNEVGCTTQGIANCCGNLKVNLGPSLIFDDEGNAIMQKIDDDMEIC